MIRKFTILIILAFLLILPTNVVYGNLRVVVINGSNIDKIFAKTNTTIILRDNIDLKGKTIRVGEGNRIVFQNGILCNGSLVLDRGCSVEKGRLNNVELNIGADTDIKNCVFDNTASNICIQSYGKDKKQNIHIDGCTFRNVGNSLKVNNSVHCVYLNYVSDVIVEKCQFLNIGNIYSQKVSGISVNSFNQKANEGLDLSNIEIVNNVFNNIVSKDNSDTRIGEYHFIIVCSTKNLTISKNNCNNTEVSNGFGKEPIYLKCDNAVVEKNKIEGFYGGEAVICVKNYTNGGTSLTPNVDILNNTIRGTFFAAIYHTGNGVIKGNTIENTQAYAISCENHLTKEEHYFVIEDNNIQLGNDVPRYSTGTARATITLLSFERCPVKAIIKENIIGNSVNIDIIRCRFAYDTYIELINNRIDEHARLVSFTNLNGKEQSFIMHIKSDSSPKFVTISRPKSSKFKVFEVKNGK